MIVELREIELNKCHEMLRLITFLQQTWGKWTCDSPSGDLTFGDDSQSKDYRSLAAKIEAEDLKMSELQKKLELIRQSTK